MQLERQVVPEIKKRLFLFSGQGIEIKLVALGSQPPHKFNPPWFFFHTYISHPYYINYPSGIYMSQG